MHLKTLLASTQFQSCFPMFRYFLQQYPVFCIKICISPLMGGGVRNKYGRLDGFQNRNFSQLWGMVSPGRRCWPIQFPGEGSIHSLQMATFLPYPYMLERERGSQPSGVSSYKVINHILVTLSKPNYF